MACKVVRVKIGRRSFMAHKGDSCRKRAKRRGTPAAFKPWARAAKACKGKGKIGSSKRTSCMKAHVRAH